jgi:succinyl-diaminopimelate desuccinylase
MPSGAATGPDDAALRAELVERLLEQLAVPSPTGEEAALADALEARYRARGEPVARVGDSLVIGDLDDARPLVLLVGHLDTVPATDDDREPRLEVVDGVEVVVGRGASDMKSGNVVAMHCFEDVTLRAASPSALALVLYAREEGPADANELARVLAEVPALTRAGLAIVLEPTDGTVELGCMGGLHALVTFRGRAAHSARPWLGTNALTAAGRFLGALDALAPIDVEVDGLVWREVVVATRAWTGGLGPAGAERSGGGANVVPERFTVDVNLRFAPSRPVEAAEAELVALLTELADVPDDVVVEVEVADRAPPSPPARDVPAVAALIDALGVEVRPKQAWTDVARFAAAGVPAVNLGPGATAQAHQRGEHVPVAALAAVATALRAALT